MTEPATETATTSEPIGPSPLDYLFDDGGAPPTPQAAEATPSAPAQAAASTANVPVDPLAEELYAENVLQTPEQAREAAKLLREERAKVAELRKKAMNAHAAAEKREGKLTKRERAVLESEHRVAAFDRAISGNLQDLESGDAERFLTAVARMSKSADPASYWKKVSMKLASGGTFTEAEKRQAQADPETQQRIAQLEHQWKRQEQAAIDAEIERRKTHVLEHAQKSEAHPYTQLYAREQPANIRAMLANIMIEQYEDTGTPIDENRACDILEASLKAQYELSQRVGGNTDGKKGTAGSGPEAGRETSKEPPKPETATRAPTTVPASLTATQGQAQRALTPREQRAQQVQSLPQWFFDQFGV